MSSFVVNTNVIDATLNGVDWLHKKGFDPFKLGHGVLLMDRLTQLGRDLYRLNIIGCDGNPDAYPPYRYLGRPYEVVACFKAASCLEYQIDGTSQEGDPLFAKLSAFTSDLAKAIVMNLPAAHDSSWCNPQPSEARIPLTVGAR